MDHKEKSKNRDTSSFHTLDWKECEGKNRYLNIVALNHLAVHRAARQIRR